MNRAQLLTALAAMVEDGELTEEEAALIVALYDRGEIPQESLPLPPAKPERSDIPFRGDITTRLAQDMSEQFIKEARAYATLPLAQWHEEMRWYTVWHMTQLLAGGYRSANVPPALQERLDAEVSRQAAYLQRFAEQRFVREQVPERTTMSEAEVASRSALYGGAGYGLYWIATVARENRSGMIVEFVANDDERTCAPCSAAAANGPYLPDSGHPLPGIDCTGGSRCRCSLETRYAPEVAASLA